jgi:hypothetical protein
VALQHLLHLWWQQGAATIGLADPLGDAHRRNIKGSKASAAWMRSSICSVEAPAIGVMLQRWPRP